MLCTCSCAIVREIKAMLDTVSLTLGNKGIRYRGIRLGFYSFIPYSVVSAFAAVLLFYLLCLETLLSGYEV